MENRIDLLNSAEENRSSDELQAGVPGAAVTVRTVPVESMDELIRLFGVFDENLKIIEDETGARIRTEADCIRIEGEEASAELAAEVADKLLMTLRRGETIDRSRIRYAVDLAKEGYWLPNESILNWMLD